MQIDKKMRALAREIESCLDCFEWFEYRKELESDEDKIRIRNLFNRGPWLFPPYKGVMGFFGTGKVFFVCKQPSTGTFPNKNVENFYRLLKENCFADAHITDIVKCRSRVGEIKDEGWKEWADTCFKHLEKELETLDPDLIVAVGEEAYNYLKNKLQSPYRERGSTK